jgi:HAD superfamily hydrolase (TIGR01549 family)
MSGTQFVVKAVVFDLDGTLVDTMSYAPAVYADTVRALGGPDINAEDVAAVWHIGPTPVLLQHLLGRPVTSTDLDCYFTRFDTAFAHVRAFPGIPEMLAALAAARMPLGVFTTATARAAASIIAAAGLTGRFPIVVGGDETPRPKPAPDGLQIACARLGCLPERAAYVGDSPIDLDCAAAAGALGVLAAWGYTSLDVRFDRPSAEVVVHLPDDLVRLVGRR